ncbi:alpha/beta fold hydrolase [Microbacterium sp. cx-59]|uniref:alpha/beta fold hydrolase n=1 Tax=Microbacterium sp. cx-59 TaxID=2891207 RepID=UPI001E4734BF|nr:alpha/beta fold hydrolase [Microbacterium sp. cx-59]MCC4909346.1 alpha/beta fold hydrolase [Microbacterium sp. cx-59]
MVTSPVLPSDLPGVDPRFSRTVEVAEHAADGGRIRRWHLLDTGDELARLGAPVAGTVLAVHGNPTWSYLWRALVSASVAAAEAGRTAWRVIAVDQLDMGFSERTGTTRRLATRVRDLGALTDALGIEGPVVTLGHDWGGVVSLGWAVDHPGQLSGVMLLNTAVHHPEGVPIPAPLRLARARGMLAASTVRTSAFLDTTLALASPALAADVKAAFRSPYRGASRRGGVGGFVDDIPVDRRHASHAELERIAAGVAGLEVPALLLWGPRDPVFVERYLDDLITRLPHADVHRFEGAGHLLAEDRAYDDAVLGWLDDNRARIVGESDAPATRREARERGAVRTAAETEFTPLWAALDARRDDDGPAVIDMSPAVPMRVSWRVLDDRVRRIAAGLHDLGVRRGDRVSLLVPPGATLTAVIYACLRIGAVVVVADAGLGVKGLSRAVRGARPSYVIGERTGLAAARALGWPGIRISATRLPSPVRRALGVTASLSDLVVRGGDLPEAPGPEDLAAILFTSGSTGPAKGVVYTHRQLSALRDTLGRHFEVTPDTGLVTGFAPFALLGPALGTRSVTPDMDVSAPRTLTASAVAAAVRESRGKIVFLSPAAILNVVATADALTADDRAALVEVQTFLSTGAPIGAGLLASTRELMPNAVPHTPYGMTECLLVTDITLDGIRAAEAAPDRGVCVGSAIGENRVLISALDADGNASGAPSESRGVLGEIVISAPHLKTGYDRLWLTDRAAIRDVPDADGRRWHRTGDVGHLDADGRLWVEGRLPHVIVTAEGPVAPVGPEQDVERLPGVRRAAVVGVGPQGLRNAVAVVETLPAARRPAIADDRLAAAVRASSELPIVAVLVVPSLPTDIRHNSKIDRARLSAWADRILAGERPTAP